MKNYLKKIILLSVLTFHSLCIRGDQEGEKDNISKKRYRMDSLRVNTVDPENDVMSSSIYASVEFDLILEAEKNVRIRIGHVYINRTGVERILAGRNNNEFDADMLKGLTMAFSRINNVWESIEPIHGDMPIGADVVFSTIIGEAFPLIFPTIPDDFESHSGFKWSTDGGQHEMITYHGDASVVKFEIVDVYEFMNKYKVAVIKGEQRYVKNEENFMGNTHRMIHIEYDTISHMAINAFERFSRRQKFIFPPRGDTLIMGTTNVFRIPFN